MNVVAIVTSILESVTAKKLAKAEKRNQKAVSRARKAKADVDKSNFEYNKQLVDVGVQLTKIQTISYDINQKALSGKKKAEKMNALLEVIED